MTTLEIILIAIIWIAYGVFNSWQHEWFEKDYDKSSFLNVMVVLFAPIAFIIRIIRGVFVWQGEHK